MVKYNGSGPEGDPRCVQTGMFLALWDAGQVVARGPQVMAGRGRQGLGTAS